METLVIIFLIFCLGAILIWHQNKQKKEIELINLAIAISQDLYHDPEIKIQCDLFDYKEVSQLDQLTDRDLYRDREINLEFANNYSISARIQTYHDPKIIKTHVTVWYKSKEIVKIKKERS